MSLSKISAGVLLVEALIALGLAALFLTAAGQLSSITLSASDISQKRAQAGKLANEGMEALYLIRGNGGFDFNPAPASDAFITAGGEYYQPAFSGGDWLLGAKSSTVPPAPLASPYEEFTRTVTVERVSRTSIGLACTGEIAVSQSGACDDFNTRKVTVSVTWNEAGLGREFTLETFLTNI